MKGSNGANMTSANRLIQMISFLLLSTLFAALVAAPGFCESGEVLSSNSSGGWNTRAAVDPITSRKGLSVVLYDTSNGLQTSEANAIAETSEGFIWIGSYSGLIRYDGDTFERVDSVGIDNAISLYVDSRDRLWIGTNDSGVAVMEDGAFHMWGPAEGLPSASVHAIVEDANGFIYVGTTTGIAIIGPAMNFYTLNDPRINDAYICELRIGPDGLIYGLTKAGDLFTVKDRALVSFLGHEECRVEGVTCILPDPKNSGALYLGTNHSRIYYGSLERNFAVLGIRDIAPLSGAESLEYINDQVWICAGNGIGAANDQGFGVLIGAPMNNSIRHVMTDYEGNLWFTSTRQGVMKIVPNRFSNLFGRYDLDEAVVNATCKAGSLLFIGTDTGLIALDEGEHTTVTHLPLSKAATASGVDLGESDLLEMLKGCRIRSIMRDSLGRLWFSTWQKQGLLRYDHGELTAFTVEDGLLSNRVRIVCERRDGSFLVANTGGVSIIEGDRVTRCYGEEDGLVNTEILTVTEGFNGDIILGSDGGGIYVIDESGVRCIGTNDGLKSDVVMRIKKDPKLDIYWIVTSNSLACMTADYRVTTLEHFPYSNNFDLYENSRGDVWILSSNGIYVAPAEELLANGEIAPVHYGMSNGLPFISTANSYCELTPAGDLYIAGSTGVAKVNIENTFEYSEDLKAAVPYVDADGVRIYPDKNGNYIIAAGVRKLTIYSYVFNYSLIDPQVSYRLEGFDRADVTVNRSELGPVTYTNLHGGNYRFSMDLKDPSTRKTHSLSVQITKLKAFYEQVWFYILIGLLFVLLVAYFIRQYLGRKIRLLEKKHAEEAEKERLGTELHMANQIQASMMPHSFPPFPDREEFDIYASMRPAKEVGGDFYDFFLIDEDHLCLVMADVSGKGVPAALFMMASKIILQSCAMLGKSAAEILTKTNEAICSNNSQQMFVTVWLGILEISTGRLTAANAGHEYPALRRANGAFEILKDRHGFVIGGMEGIRYMEYEIQLNPGDKIFQYTDGVTEAMNSDNELFGIERMKDALNLDPDGGPQEILGNVSHAVQAFVGDAEQFDDLTMLCVEYRGAAPQTGV